MNFNYQIKIINYDKNNYQIRFWLLNNYKIKIMIELNNRQDNLY